jgi:hypothetical protein
MHLLKFASGNALTTSSTESPQERDIRMAHENSNDV